MKDYLSPCDGDPNPPDRVLAKATNVQVAGTDSLTYFREWRRTQYLDGNAGAASDSRMLMRWCDAVHVNLFETVSSSI
jgi:hypothetical protein